MITTPKPSGEAGTGQTASSAGNTASPPASTAEYTNTLNSCSTFKPGPTRTLNSLDDDIRRSTSSRLDTDDLRASVPVAPPGADDGCELRSEYVSTAPPTATAAPPTAVCGPLPGFGEFSRAIPVAPTLVYDHQASHDIETDPDWRARWARVTVRTVVYSGDRTFSGLPEAADAVAAALSNAKRRVLAGQDHGPAPEVIVPELVRFLRSAA
jgi:pimeloyl-ACP methyl ester carboxylesterase